MGELGDHILDPRVEDDAMEESEGPPKKKRRQRYSNETKIQVILALETRPNASLNDVSKEFNVAPGTVRGWREEADKIQTQAMENRRVGAKANPSRDPLRRVWNAILTLFEKNSRLPQSQRLDVNVAVVKTIGAQARNALLEAHEKEPFLTETEVSAMKKFKARYVHYVGPWKKFVPSILTSSICCCCPHPTRPCTAKHGPVSGLEIIKL
jgi:transposase-like protein